MDADILIFDEVLSVGDIEFTHKCNYKIASIVKSGKSVIVASHNMNELLGLSHRAILIESGRLVAQGSAFELIGKYLNDEEDLLSSDLRSNEKNGQTKIKRSVKRNSLETNSKYVFDAEEGQCYPGLKILKVSVFAKGRKDSSDIFVKDEVCFNVELRLHELSKGLEFVMQINNQANIQIMAFSPSLLLEESKVVTMTNYGYYNYTGTFPSFTFMPGVYRASIGVIGPGEMKHVKQNVLVFEVNSIELKLKDTWYQNAPVMVGPIAKWDMKFQAAEF